MYQHSWLESFFSEENIHLQSRWIFQNFPSYLVMFNVCVLFFLKGYSQRVPFHSAGGYTNAVAFSLPFNLRTWFFICNDSCYVSFFHHRFCNILQPFFLLHQQAGLMKRGKVPLGEVLGTGINYSYCIGSMGLVYLPTFTIKINQM